MGRASSILQWSHFSDHSLPPPRYLPFNCKLKEAFIMMTEPLVLPITSIQSVLMKAGDTRPIPNGTWSQSSPSLQSPLCLKLGRMEDVFYRLFINLQRKFSCNESSWTVFQLSFVALCFPAFLLDQTPCKEVIERVSHLLSAAGTSFGHCILCIAHFSSHCLHETTKIPMIWPTPGILSDIEQLQTEHEISS